MRPAPQNGNGSHAQMLLCDFHIHTNYSDGKLSVPEIMILRRARIRLHLHHRPSGRPETVDGKLSELASLTLGQETNRRIFRSHRTRTPARLAALQDARDDGN